MNIFDKWSRARSTAQRAPGLQDALREGCQACNCIGPQNGQPVCPCEMRHVVIEGGRYVKRVDLGPAPTAG